MRERDVERHLVTAAAAVGGLAVKHVSPGRSGDPDRLIAIPTPTCPTCGRGCAVGLLELKAPGEQPRPLQRARILEWESLGVQVGFADTKSRVDEFLRNLK